MPADFVSVIVPCRNERRHIRTFLDSVMRQETARLDWEIIIADGLSDDGTRDILAECRDPRLVVIENPQRTVSAGLNAAIRMARGNIVIRMDCHTEYRNDYILRCVEVLHGTGADNVGGPARTRVSGRLARAIAAAYHSPFSTGGARFHNDNYQGYVDTVTYGCWFKSTLERIGLFDEALVRNQDDELNLRLIRAGGKIWQSPEIVSWYSPRGSLSGLFRQYSQYGFWKVAVIRKHRIPASWRHLVPGSFVIGNVALLAGALIFRQAFFIWLAAIVLYALGCCLAAVLAAKNSGWDILALLPLVFAVFHVSYGLGFIVGLCYWPVAGSEAHRAGKAFTALSR
jgi:succinoglycan biosynthesis protein ExoA